MSGKVLLVIIITASMLCDAHRLDRVVILGRHNLRAPLVANLLEKVTPNVWPKWNETAAHLTAKGRLLESYMAEYFSQWLKKEGLFNECPEHDKTLIYANAPQRTRETALVFTENAFKNCNLTVIYKSNVVMDPVFNPIIRNKTDAFKQKGTEEMQRKLDESQLEKVYQKLNKILKINESRMCSETKICDLTKMKNVIRLNVGEEPNIDGPLSIANSVLDNFLMTFYKGTAFEDIGWAGIENEDWNDLTKISRENQNVRFNGTYIASHVAELLLRKIENIVSNDDLKFALLVGHDSNIVSVLANLRVKPIELPNQLEGAPIGGKLVFQKWYDESRNIFLFKLEYVYQTTDQIRFGIRLSLDSPPKAVTLELSDCKPDENGFCAWQDFVHFMSKFK